MGEERKGEGPCMQGARRDWKEKRLGMAGRRNANFFFKPTHSSIVTPFRRHKNLNYYFLHFTILHCIESTH